MAHNSVTTALSAPGKVLLAGGYLVLDRNYSGTVFALDARIHVIVQQRRRTHRRGTSGSGTAATLETQPADDGSVVDDQDAEDTIVVRSPQFDGATWEYGVQRCENGGGIRVTQKNEGKHNPFVETSLNYALTYISYVADSKDFGALSITILADSDYYSETPTSKASTGRFVNFGVPLHEAHKTGLGSSAALVTALVSALVVHRTLQPDDLGIAREKLHNLAQAAHCAAQGKVGSGFDVAAAIYGSCLYRRFSPSILQSIGDIGTPAFENRLFSIVLEWRQQHPATATQLWDALQANNERLVISLQQHRAPQEDPADNDFATIRQLLGRSRSLLRSMTAQSGVPVEPKVQTELLDAVSAVEGVIGGVVPGAGGYDAIALLIRDDLAVIERLEQLFAGWKSQVEDDFGGKIGTVRLLGVRHGSDGVVNESVEQYSEWI
ncbi:Phosphomevalonate kinase [Aspergillus campestris IBT 28561]|uniref:Phosphomevalonate kinase n=1 Tax=Aspergillus campestris (strain IBT 28561) TaxID=1392248 RepID=A0A2I1D1K4_ASPC2|nr:Phosphomevalonate kinase [Aspergillus campestris IBT 28561]PKY03764.1 Phosphomevalonate kinase [Aspergillus campestris IBT 28561]